MSSPKQASFCTAVNCMDGRVQLPVIEYLMRRTGAGYVDSITEPGPIRLLAEEPEGEQARSIMSRIDISVHEHGSRFIAVVGHYDCAGNPLGQQEQEAQTLSAVETIAAKWPDVQVIGLWVDSGWRVHELDRATD